MQKERVINIDAIIIIFYRSCFIIISNAFLKICASHPKTKTDRHSLQDKYNGMAYPPSELRFLDETV